MPMFLHWQQIHRHRDGDEIAKTSYVEIRAGNSQLYSHGTSPTDSEPNHVQQIRDEFPTNLENWPIQVLQFDLTTFSQIIIRV